MILNHECLRNTQVKSSNMSTLIWLHHLNVNYHQSYIFSMISASLKILNRISSLIDIKRVYLDQFEHYVTDTIPCKVSCFKYKDQYLHCISIRRKYPTTQTSYIKVFSTRTSSWFPHSYNQLGSPSHCRHSHVAWYECLAFKSQVKGLYSQGFWASQHVCTDQTNSPRGIKLLSVKDVATTGRREQ